MVEEQDQLRKTAAEAKAQFAGVKQQRREAFMRLYDAIDTTIDRVYKKLTRVRDQPNRSGTAYLALEDTEEPYLEGIKFTAMPPHKRFSASQRPFHIPGSKTLSQYCQLSQNFIYRTELNIFRSFYGRL
jgi:chromosome segregation ATPase